MIALFWMREISTHPEWALSDPNQALDELLADNRERLCRIVRLRLDSRLTGRIDESDVIQEAFVDASARYSSFEENSEVSPFVWLRFLTLQKLAQMHRKHIRVKARSVRREASLEASSVILADELIKDGTTPIEAALRAERKKQITAAIDSLGESDREILALRHFEYLSNQECAEVLAVETATAYKRYARALERLRAALESTSLSGQFE